MKTRQTKMELVAYQKDDDKKVKTYQLLHYNEKTRLEQKIKVTKRQALHGWEVSLNLDDFPRLETETEALLKYADWLERMGIAIRREAKRAIKRGVEWWNGMRKHLSEYLVATSWRFYFNSLLGVRYRF
ncbi:hypothetical protein QS817_18935 [Providencia rettgeri]|nr:MULTISPECIES: hypothetical protein [Providencia]MDL9985204.1 hypothetical protein [Providencia rettgeri]